MTLHARFSPQELFRLCRALRHPLIWCKHSRGNREGFLRQVRIRICDAQFRWMRGDVLPKPQHYKSVNHRWSIVRHAFRKTFIELQPVAGNALLCVGDG